MNSKDFIRAGRLSEARQQLINEVKASPADMGKRTLLFQVHSLLGEWEKADRHLDVIATQDIKAEIGVQAYKNIVLAERERMEVVRNTRLPSFMPETPSYFELYRAACKKLAEKNIEEAEEFFTRIDNQIHPITGTLNGKGFEGFRDTDAYYAFFLEAIVHERYIWIPFESIRELSISPPRTLFDLLWVPAEVTTWEALSMKCYLPVLYAESFLHDDNQIKLGRMTDWNHLGGPFSKASGQHVFQVGEEETALLDIREVIFTLPGAVENQ